MRRAHAETMRAATATSGAAFVPYARRPGYGITILSRRWVEIALARLAGDLRPIRFVERGWDAHQDVWSCHRVAEARAPAVRTDRRPEPW